MDLLRDKIKFVSCITSGPIANSLPPTSLPLCPAAIQDHLLSRGATDAGPPKPLSMLPGALPAVLQPASFLSCMTPIKGDFHSLLEGSGPLLCRLAEP